MLGNKQSNGTVYYLKMKGTKKLETPYFSVTQKDSDGKYPEIMQVNQVSGRLEDIKKGTFTWEGKEQKTVEFKIRDMESDELYLVKFSLNNLTRGILNSLAACESITNIELSCWLDKASGYPRLYAKVNGEKTAWKWDKDFMTPMIEKVTNKKGEVVSVDTTELDEFFMKIIDTDILPKLSGMAGVIAADKMELQKPPDEERKTRKPKSVPAETNVSDSDLPF